jgi:hypothetical protein
MYRLMLVAGSNNAATNHLCAKIGLFETFIFLVVGGSDGSVNARLDVLYCGKTSVPHQSRTTGSTRCGFSPDDGAGATQRMF